jgi:hypothetical protein
MTGELVLVLLYRIWDFGNIEKIELKKVGCTSAIQHPQSEIDDPQFCTKT